MPHLWRPMEVLLPSVYTERGQLTAVLISSGTALSGYCVQQPPRHQRWRRGFGLALASPVRLMSGTGGGGNNAAGWTGRRRDPHEASKGTTTRGIGSALFAGQAKALDAIRTVIRSLIAPLCRSCGVIPSRRLHSGLRFAAALACSNSVFVVFRQRQPEWVNVKFVATGAAGMELQFFRFFESF